MYKEDGSSTLWKKDYQSIRDVISDFADTQCSTLFYQFERDAENRQLKENAQSSFSKACDLLVKLDSKKARKIDFEVTVKEITYELEPAYIIIFQDITNVIKN